MSHRCSSGRPNKSTTAYLVERDAEHGGDLRLVSHGILGTARNSDIVAVHGAGHGGLRLHVEVVLPASGDVPADATV